MKISELIKKIESRYPTNSALDFDNPGAIIVEPKDNIKNIVVSLDVTLKAIDVADKNNANIIISHHPMIFHAIKRINIDPTANRIKKLIKNGINAYAIHTNFDANIKYGMGQAVLNLIFNKNEYEKHSYIEAYEVNRIKYGIGDVIELKKGISFDNLSDKVFKKLDLTLEHASKYNNSNGKLLKKIIIIPGSGSGNVDDVISEGADCLITSDLKHNQILDLMESGISYIDATHYGLEKVFVQVMTNYLKKICGSKIKIITCY